MGDAGLFAWEPMGRLHGALRSTGLFVEGEVTFARAPGRLDVMGGVADYTGSLVCEMPLAAAAGAAVQRRNDHRVVCRSEQTGRTLHLSALDLETPDPGSVRRLMTGDDAWARYAVGCLWWLMRHGGRLAPGGAGATVLIDSDVPLGGGVSSSAAMEVATMSALAAMLGARLAPMRLAAACQEVENHVVGAPCGVMDQVASTLGRQGRLLEILCQPDADGLPAQVLGDVAVPGGFKFIGIHSGVRHEVSGDPYTDTRVAAFMGQRILADQIGEAERQEHLANVPADRYMQSLRASLPTAMHGGAFLARYGSTADPVTTVRPDREYHVRAATDHHVLEMARVRRFVRLLRGEVSEESEEGRSLEERMRQAGRLMAESHQSYGQCARLGHPMTDKLVELAEALGPEAGFYGAKITGGGCGGTVALLVRDAAETAARVAALRERYTGATGRPGILFDGSSPGAAALGTRTLQLGELS